MNCSKCNTQMEEGQFDRTLWIKKPITALQRFMIGKVVGAESHYTVAYRCPNCKRIELYTEDIKQSIQK